MFFRGNCCPQQPGTQPIAPNCHSETEQADFFLPASFLRSGRPADVRNLSSLSRRQLAFDNTRREDLRVAATFQPGQLVRVNLAGLQAEGVMFQAAVTDAVAHIVKQTSEQPPTYLVKLLFSFRGVTEVEVPADRIHADK